MKILKKIICICLVAILAAGLFPGAQTEVYAAGKPVQLVSCKVNSVGSKVTVKAKVAGIQKGMGKKLYLFSVDANVKENAKLAGVEQYIHFQRRGIEALSHPKKYGFIITNPPYGEWLEDKNTIASIYRTLGERYRQLDSWSLYMITSYEDAQQMIGRKADKNRKIYNGMLKTYYYQFMGPKPGSRS